MGDPFTTGRAAEVVALAARYVMPAAYQWREFAMAGGLMSYGTSLADAYRQVGLYAGAILKGAKRRPTRAAVRESRVGHQPQDRQGAWSRCTACVADPR